MIKMCVFDVAGTTVNDSDHAVARRLCEAVASVGVEIGRDVVDPVMGWHKPRALGKVITDAKGRPATSEEVAQALRVFQERMADHYRTADIGPMPGAEEVFASLRERGIKVGLDTGFGRHTLAVILERLGWDASVIDGSVASDEVGAGRPAPDMIHALMERFGVTDPAEVAKVGDSVSDLEQGAAAGCSLVVAVNCERTRQVIADFPGCPMIDHLSELPAMIERAPAGV